MLVVAVHAAPLSAHSASQFVALPSIGLIEKHARPEPRATTILLATELSARAGAMLSASARLAIRSNTCPRRTINPLLEAEADQRPTLWWRGS